MHRLLYIKEGNARWISHLDMMRLVQRCFLRAGISIRHTEGYNPHAFVSIALPLSVGQESDCELLDFELTDQSVTLAEIPDRLNAVFPAGLRALAAYESSRKVRELTLLRAQVRMEYDHGVPADAEKQVAALFTRPELPVEKKSKKGMVETDILPMIRSVAVRTLDRELWIEAVVCAQNPSLNPELLANAVRRWLPEYAPDFVRVRRLEVLDENLETFR